MKKIVSCVLALSVLLTGCTSAMTDTASAPQATEAVTTSFNYSDLSLEDYIEADVEYMDFSSMSDSRLLPFVEDTVYLNLVEELDEDMYVQDVSAIYISQEYIDELTYNSQANIFFGYTLQELEEQFQGEPYVFTVENGQTVVQPATEYDDTYDQIIRNVAIGTGVIAVCVTVGLVSGGVGAAAVSSIFFASAQTGAIMGLSGGIISGAAAGLSTGLTTGDWDSALDDGLLAGSEGFMFGAISGAVTGGAFKTLELHNMTAGGLTMDEAAIIQRESRFDPEIISRFRNVQEYEVYRDAGLISRPVGGRAALIRDIDLDYVSPNNNPEGLTNLQLMQSGRAPFDPTGARYELHHVGQSMDSPLAILTTAEHDMPGLHIQQASQINRNAFNIERQNFWITLAQMAL
ncbi:MAG: HNH/ENDO VII family nuclease [Saccharofermentans sp.]|nr:HNH/ENDO VII family nuclease [Saccharofermentans sp.]